MASVQVRQAQSKADGKSRKPVTEGQAQQQSESAHLHGCICKSDTQNSSPRKVAFRVGVCSVWWPTPFNFCSVRELPVVSSRDDTRAEFTLRLIFRLSWTSLCLLLCKVKRMETESLTTCCEIATVSVELDSNDLMGVTAKMGGL